MHDTGWRPGWIIAQRFSAGTTKHRSLRYKSRSDERLDERKSASSVPAGTPTFDSSFPALKRWAIFS